MKLSAKLFRKRSYTWGVACFLIYFLFFNASVSVVTAGPEGAQVVNGQVTIQQSGSNTAITASDKAIINYSSFDIAQPETVRFIQPGSNASVLNRILSANPTNINGTLLANGRVFFVNPAGVYIGNGARINVNQLVASGLNISNADFINGSYNFAGGNGAVINDGDISAQRVYLIGKQVTNSGNISCPAGYVVMAAGDRVFLGELGSDIVLDVEGTSLSESANAAIPEVGVLNEGTIEAAGGIIALAAAGDIYSQAISNVGSLSTSVDAGDAGMIKLASAGGEVVNTGTIEASGSVGGQVVMEGARVGQFGTIHADGIMSNGGNVNLLASDVVALSSDSLTTANAGLNGDGGDVTVFSPDTALFWPDAIIEAKGGTVSGDGGFVEVSGRQNVYINGWVDASAANGEAGTFLIDPTDITIQDAAGDITDDGDGTFTSTANANTISDDTIEGYLDAGTSVILDTSDGDGGGGGGGGAWEGNGDITQNADAQINKGAGGAATLTLIAERDIVINGGIVSTTGTLGVVLTATGSVDLNAAVTTNGGTFTSSGVDFDNTSGAITTAGGSVTLTHTGDVTIGGALSTGSGTVDLDAGGTLALNAGISTSSGDVDIDSTGVTTVAAAGDITAGGAVTFGAAKIGTLTTSGDIDTSDDNVTFTNAVTLDGNVDIDTTGAAAGDILFGSTIATGGNNLSLDAGTSGDITLSDALTGGGDVTVRDGAIQSYQAMTLNSLAIQDATTSVTFNGDVTSTTNIGVVSGGTVVVAAGDHLIAGGDGTALNINGAGITLNAGGAGTETVTNTGNGTITITDSANTSLGNNSISIGTGALTINSANMNAQNSGGDNEIYAGGNVSLTGAEIGGGNVIDIEGATALEIVDTGAGDIEIREQTASTITSTTITVANATSGNIDITYYGGVDAVQINNGHEIDTTTLDHNFSYTAEVGSITDNGTVTLTGATASFTTGTANDTITLDNQASTAAFSFTTKGTAGDVTLDNGDTALDLGISSVYGNLDVTAGEAITQSGALTVAGTSSFTTDVADKAITLNDASNALSGTVSFSTTDGGTDAGHVTLDNGDAALDLGSSSIYGNLDVTAGEAITQSGALSVAGASSFTTDEADKAITLNDISNEFNGAMSLNTLGTGNATIVNAIGVDLAESNVGGSLDVTAATGDITDSGLVSVDDNASFTTSNANDDIDLGTLAVTGAIDLSTTGGTGNATIVNAVGVDLAASNIGGDLDVTANTGDLEINDSVTAGGTISLEATAGAITQSAGTITTAIDGSLSMKSNGDLDMANYTVASPGTTDLILDSTGGSAIVTGSAADNWKSITAAAQSNVVLAGDGDITAGNLESRSTSGLNGVRILTDTGSGGSLDAQGTITSGGYVEVNVEGNASFADTVTAGGNIELEAGGNLEINGDLTATSGGVSLISTTGKIYTPGGSNDTLNIVINGYSAPGVGVELPGPGVGVAAISIRSAQDLIIGDSAKLNASGTYNPLQYDDRSSVGFDDSISGGGDPIDVAIYLRSNRPYPQPSPPIDPSGNVTVGSKVTIGANGSMIVDAGEKVIFEGKFNESVFNQTHRLEVVSRRSDNLNEVVRYDRLPFADNPEAIRDWFNESTGYFAGAYVLRGVKTLLAEVLALTNPVPLVPPRTLEPEFRSEVEGPDTEALANLLSELGIGVQPYVTEAYAEFLSTDLRLYKAAEKLQGLMPILEETNGTRIAGLRKAVAQYFPTLDSLSDEQMESFTQVLENHKGDGTDFDLAGQCIFALREYVNILSTEIGWPVEKSVEFVMGRYVPRITENDEIRIAVIQMHLQK